MKRIAIFADLHANMCALDAFLSFLEQYEPVDHILNLGDFLQIGPHPRRVAAAVLGDKRITSVLGNNESSLLHRNPGGFTAGEYAHQDWTISRLGSSLLDRIGALPKRLNMTIEGLRLLALHSRENSLASRPLLYESRSLDEFFADYDADADVVLFGHTHEQLYLEHRGRIIVNPGPWVCRRLAGHRSACFSFRMAPWTWPSRTSPATQHQSWQIWQLKVSLRPS